MDADKVIQQISEVRKANNICWMELLSIAFKYAPEEAKKIFKQITTNDKQINKLSKDLCK